MGTDAQTHQPCSRPGTDVAKVAPDGFIGLSSPALDSGFIADISCSSSALLRAVARGWWGGERGDRLQPSGPEKLPCLAGTRQLADVPEAGTGVWPWEGGVLTGVMPGTPRGHLNCPCFADLRASGLSLQDMLSQKAKLCQALVD